MYQPSTNSRLCSISNNLIDGDFTTLSADQETPVDSWQRQINHEHYTTLRLYLRKKIVTELLPTFSPNSPQDFCIVYLSQYAEYTENGLYKVAKSSEEHLRMVAAKIEMMKVEFEEPSGWIGLFQIRIYVFHGFPFVNSLSV